MMFILKDLYIRAPKFSKQYKYMLGEKMLESCIDNIVLINYILRIKTVSNTKRILPMPSNLN